jgi:hypothetical protein
MNSTSSNLNQHAEIYNKRYKSKTSKKDLKEKPPENPPDDAQPVKA